jgi:hypothetical protein
MLLADDHRLRVAKCCTIRMQVDHCLIYNTHTDELHVIPLPAAEVLKLCDGTRTVRAIADAVTAAAGVAPGEARSRMDEFAYELVKRGILTIGTGDAA